MILPARITIYLRDGSKIVQPMRNRRRKKLIVCPVCGSLDIEMVPSSVAIVGKGSHEREVTQPRGPDARDESEDAERFH